MSMQGLEGVKVRNRTIRHWHTANQHGATVLLYTSYSLKVLHINSSFPLFTRSSV